MSLPKLRGRVPSAKVSGMNRLEAAYADRLTLLLHTHNIAAWWYQPLKFRLADRTYYTPDFLVQRCDGTLELHETKGWMRDDANVKLKVTAALYWLFPVYLVKQTRGAWDIRQVETTPS